MKRLSLMLAAFAVLCMAVSAQAKSFINGIDANYPPFAYVGEDGKPKSEVEILIERINKIRRELPAPEKREMSPEEQAFTEAADEQFEALSELQKRRFRNRRR